MNHAATIKNFIAKGKWAVFYIQAEGNTPAFAYTAGLTHYGLHELLITGNLRPQDACGILNRLGDMLRARKERNVTTVAFDNGELVGIGGNFPLTLRDANDTARTTLMLKTSDFYQGKFKAQQVIYPDAKGRLPTDPASDFAGKQPLFI